MMYHQYQHKNHTFTEIADIVSTCISIFPKIAVLMASVSNIIYHNIPNSSLTWVNQDKHKFLDCYMSNLGCNFMSEILHPLRVFYCAVLTCC